MRRVCIVLLMVLVGMASAVVTQEKEATEDSKPSSFQPKPLDDEWSEWLIGKWVAAGAHSDFLGGELEGFGESNEERVAVYTIELDLNGQFLIWRTLSEAITDEQKKQVKEALGKYVSDEELERFVSMPYKSLLIQTIDPKTGDRIAYLFDSQRLYGRGRGRLAGNKEIMEWEWSGIGQGVTSVSIMEKIDENKLIVSMEYTLPGGRKMKEGLELTRRNETPVSATGMAGRAEDLAAVKRIAEDSHTVCTTDEPEARLTLDADDATVMVSMVSSTTNQKKKNTEKDVSSSFQPMSLDDEWSKWLVGKWKGTVGLGGIRSKALREIELGLNGQFLITKHEHKITDEEIQGLKKVAHISDEDAKQYQSQPFKYLEILTINQKNGEVIGYLFDSLRRVAIGKGKIQGNKEIVEWQWFVQGQRAFSSINITEKVGNDKFITTKQYIQPDGSTMEGKVEMAREMIKTK